MACTFLTFCTNGGVSVIGRGRGDCIIPVSALENVKRMKTEGQNSPDSGGCSYRLRSLAFAMVIVVWLQWDC